MARGDGVRIGINDGRQPDPAPGVAAVSAVAEGQAGQLSTAALLAAETRVRAAQNETELVHLVANELRRLVAARQVIVMRASGSGKLKVACVSSMVLGERETPFVRWIEAMIGNVVREASAGGGFAFELPAFVDKDAPETRSYPFGHLVWQPMPLPSGEVFAGVLLARERPWTAQERKVIAREALVFGSAWHALYGAPLLRPRRRIGRRSRIAMAVASVVGLLLPVPMSTLAPVEVVARQPQRVTAPIDGVIKEILVEPNRQVVAGQTILHFDRTTLQNRLQLAEQEMLLAQTRSDRATQAAFQDDKARHEMAQARAEFELKRAERDYASQLLARTVIAAERNGVIVYADKDRWIGRPVKTGERIMQIVDPSEVAARIEVPVADAIVLQRGARVRLFLDADPLTAVSGRLVSEGYQAEPNSTQQLVYKLVAEIEGKPDGLRIGARGTAQLQGDYVPLVYYLLRRPISAARQHLGL